MEKILKKVYENQKLSKALRIFSHSVVVLYCLGFLLVLYTAKSFIRAALILAIPFLLVTVSRRLLNAKRPYEVYDFYERAPKGKKGRSFPSRHVFSAFAIGTLMLFAYPVLGAVMLLLGALLAVCRVLLGIHFLRDVFCGALIGVLTSAFGALILTPFY